MSLINKSGFTKVALVTKLKWSKWLKAFLSLSFSIWWFYFSCIWAEIFKKNKRFEINEIPLEIVDVSDETVNKVENEKRKKLNQKQPKIYPDFNSKSKIQAQGSRIYKKSKKKENKSRYWTGRPKTKKVDNILNLLEKLSLLVKVSCNQRKKSWRKRVTWGRRWS